MKADLVTKEVLASLSPLERFIVSRLMPARKYRARDIYRIVKSRASKSSVSVLMDRLYKKGLVMRDVETARGGIRFVYALEQDEEWFERRAVERLVNEAVHRFGSKALVYFNETLEKRGKR